MENLFKPNVDTSVVDNLISGTLAQAKVIPVKVTGTGIVKRGTLLSSDDGISYEADAENIQAVLLLDVNAADPDSNEGPAAFGGEFNQRKIEEVMGVTLTDVAIHEARGRQIFIAPMNPAPEAF
jgi:hypothetical protein